MIYRVTAFEETKMSERRSLQWEVVLRNVVMEVKEAASQEA